MDIEKLKYIFWSEEKEEDRIQFFKLQASIIDKLDKHNYVMCFDETGLGKTIQGIYAIWNCMQHKNNEEKANILVIAPNEILAQKWQSEIKKFLGLDFTIVHNRHTNSGVEFNEEDDNLYITYNSSNYGNLGLKKLGTYCNWTDDTNAKVNFTCSKSEYYNMKLWYEYSSQVVFHDSTNNTIEFSIYIDNCIELIQNSSNLNNDKCELLVKKFFYRKYCQYSKLFGNWWVKELVKEINQFNLDTNNNFICLNKWDLIITDEAHLFYENYKKALFCERIELTAKSSYFRFIGGLNKTKKLLILTATPLKRNEEKENLYSSINEIVSKLLIDAPEVIDIDVKNLLKFSVDIPYQRYFKEVVLNNSNAKKRNVEFLAYIITDELEGIWNKCNTINPYQDGGNVFLIIKKYIDHNKTFSSKIDQAFEAYSKNTYTDEDIKKICAIDKKMEKLIDYMTNDSQEIRSIFFCTRIETRSYLEKVMKYLGIQTTVLTGDDKEDERFNKVNSFNNSSNSKKVLITTWDIGSVGINVHGADKVICYEPTTGIDKVEQGFGRIDRINLGFDEISMVYLRPEGTKLIYDNYRLNTLFTRLFTDNLPNIPSKNILFDSDYLDDYVESTKQRLEVLEHVAQFIDQPINDKESADSEEEKVYSYEEIMDWCDKNEYDFDVIAYVLFSGTTECTKKHIKECLRNYRNTDLRIKRFLDLAATHKNEGKKPSEILKEAIYYYDDDELRVISIQELIEKAKDFNPPSEECFNSGMQYISDNLYDIKNNNLICTEVGDRYIPIFAKSIKEVIRRIK